MLERIFWRLRGIFMSFEIFLMGVVGGILIAFFILFVYFVLQLHKLKTSCLDLEHNKLLFFPFIIENCSNVQWFIITVFYFKYCYYLFQTNNFHIFFY